MVYIVYMHLAVGFMQEFVEIAFKSVWLWLVQVLVSIFLSVHPLAARLLFLFTAGCLLEKLPRQSLQHLLLNEAKIIIATLEMRFSAKATVNAFVALLPLRTPLRTESRTLSCDCLTNLLRS